MKIARCNGTLQLSFDGADRCLRARERILRWRSQSEYSLQILRADGFVIMVEPSGVPQYSKTPDGWIWCYSHEEVTVQVRYALERDVLVKTVSVMATQPLMIRYAQTEISAVAEPLTRGGEGQPLFVGVTGFVSSTFPAAENRRDGTVLTIRQAPFKKLETGQCFNLDPVVFGLNVGSPTEQGVADCFRAFLLPRRPHPDDILRVYCDWGAHDELAAEYELELDEAMARRVLNDLRRGGEKTGLRYDYYLMDDCWYSPESYCRFREGHWPQGPGRFLEELREMGMEFGLWFDVNMQRIQDPGKKLLRGGSERELCIAADENMAMVFDAVEKHVRENRVRMLKFDFACFDCNDPSHDFHSHRPIANKEPAIRNFITRLCALRRDFPTMQVLGYNGFTTSLDQIGAVDPNCRGWAISPFWALYVDYLYCGDPRPAERPAPMEKSIIHYTDCMIERFTDALLPRQSIDDHGTMIGLTNTIYYLQKKSLRDSYLMNIVRGTRKLHLYGETGLLDDADWDFLAKAQKLFDFVCAPNCRTEAILQRPSSGSVYGYHNVRDDHGVVTVVNTTSVTQPVAVNVSGQLRWRRIYHHGAWCDESLALTGSLQTQIDGYEIDAYVWERVAQGDMQEITAQVPVQGHGGYVDLDAGTGVAVSLPPDTLRIGLRFLSETLSPLRAANEERQQVPIGLRGGELVRLDTMSVWSGISFAVYDIHRTDEAICLLLENRGQTPLVLHWQVLLSGKEQ